MKYQVTILVAALTLFGSQANARSVPYVWGVWEWQHSEPVQLMVSPGSASLAFTEARSQGGAMVDATIRIQLWYEGGSIEDPRPAAPVAHFPFEDIWLQSTGLVMCMGGTTADTDTDADGWFTFSQPPLMGGWINPDAASEALYVMISGVLLWDQTDVPIEPGIWINSPDINGDLHVNLSDIPVFAADYYGDYSFRSDFHWDQAINLSDVVRMAQSLGDKCP